MRECVVIEIAQWRQPPARSAMGIDTQRPLRLRQASVLRSRARRMARDRRSTPGFDGPPAA